MKQAINYLPVTLILTLIVMSVIGGGLFTSPVFVFAGSIFAVLAFHYRNNTFQSMIVPAPVLISSAAILLIAASACPLPGKLDAFTGLKRFEQNNVVREAAAAAQRLKLIKNDNAAFASTRNRSGTLRILALALFMLAAGIAASSMSEKHRNMIAVAILAAGVASAILGYLHQWVIPKDRTIWWFIHTPIGHPVGAFINRTNHAGFLAMISPLALALIMQGIYSNRPVKVLIGTASFVVMTLAVISSLSRGAVVAMGIGIAAFAIHSLFIAGRRRAALVLPLVLLALIAALQNSTRFTDPVDRKQIVERILTLSDPLSTPSSTFRIHLWKDSFRIFLDYPMIGAGANAFRTVYPQYRTESYRETFTHTENEYIQILTDGGMIAAALVSMLILTIAIRWRETARNKDMPMNMYGSGVFAGICVAAAHNAIDFPLHAPLYAFTLVVMMSAVTSNPADIITRTANVRLTSGRASFACLCTALLCISIPCIGGRSAISRDIPFHMSATDADEAVKCIVWAPTSWLAWSQLYRCAANTTDRNRYMFAIMCLDQAAEYDPNNYLLWQSIGMAKTNIGDTNGASKAFVRMKQLRPWAAIPELQMDKY